MKKISLTILAITLLFASVAHSQTLNKTQMNNPQTTVDYTDFTGEYSIEENGKFMPFLKITKENDHFYWQEFSEIKNEWRENRYLLKKIEFTESVNDQLIKLESIFTGTRYLPEGFYWKSGEPNEQDRYTLPDIAFLIVPKGLVIEKYPEAQLLNATKTGSMIIANGYPFALHKNVK